MGLILDSSIVIAAERLRETAAQFFRHVERTTGEQQVAISSIGLTEIIHGAYRTSVSEMQAKRLAFIQDLLAGLEVAPYTRSTAFLAGRLDGEQRSNGITIPSMDLLIGATALEIGYSIATINVRHFRLIPGLSIIDVG